MRQNITYTCDGGPDGFMDIKLQGINGGTLHYGDKTVRMVSRVRDLHTHVIHFYNHSHTLYKEGMISMYD